MVGKRPTFGEAPGTWGTPRIALQSGTPTLNLGTSRILSMVDFDDFRVITFDCYGTLIDWETGILGALRPLLERHGAVVDDHTLLEMYAQSEAAIEAGPYKR